MQAGSPGVDEVDTRCSVSFVSLKAPGFAGRQSRATSLWRCTGMETLGDARRPNNPRSANNVPSPRTAGRRWREAPDEGRGERRTPRSSRCARRGRLRHPRRPGHPARHSSVRTGLPVRREKSASSVGEPPLISRTPKSEDNPRTEVFDAEASAIHSEVQARSGSIVQGRRSSRCSADWINRVNLCFIDSTR